MKSVLNFVAFQLVWLAAVWGAAEGHLLAGPVVLVPALALHGFLTPAGERWPELRYVLAVGAAGAVVDSGLYALGLTHYPTSAEAWPYPVVPPWIVTLWLAFGTLPRFSLGWLAERRLLAALLGAVGGPLSYLGGARLGAVAVGDDAAATLVALGIEYALVTPLLLSLRVRGDRATR